MTQTKPDVGRLLSTLKDFQRDTVDYVFERMYEDVPPARRFLVADEVGLGKTMVAKGLVARAIDRLWETTPRIDVVYICSNGSIARQNINRLNVTGTPDHRLPDRITLLPRDIKHIARNKINFVSFTPGTSFQLKSSQGKAGERELLFWLIPDDWKKDRAGAISALTGYSDRSRFEDRVDSFLRRFSIDLKLQESFRSKLLNEESKSGSVNPTLADRFRRLAAALGRRASLTEEEARERTAIVSELRSLLAAVCVESLEPDLVILDEFQRFGDLLHGADEASALARRLFEFPDVRVLLLSATPYKMYAVGEDQATGDHYTDLIQTIGFLQHDAERTHRFRKALSGYRAGLFQFPRDGGALLSRERAVLQDELKRVMVRNERLAATPDRSGMLVEMPPAVTGADARDIRDYVNLQRVARSLGHSDVVDYWKSAPYLLNFMDEYQLKHDFTQALATGLSAEVSSLCRSEAGLLLSREDVEAFRPLDPANARLRALAADTIGAGLWKLAWLPPSLPYYLATGEFETIDRALPTKRLVFSAWQVVPKVVSALLSYEAERLLIGSLAGEAKSFLPEARTRRGRLLDFTRSAGRLGGMPVLGLLYPSIALAAEIDPLAWRMESPHQATLDEVLARAAARIETMLSGLQSPEEGEEDQRWYWAAPILLDEQRSPDANASWWGQADLAGRWRLKRDDADETESAPDVDEERVGLDDRWSDHVDEARRLLRGEIALGRRPADLTAVLALLAVAGPGVCALRALSRVGGGAKRLSEPAARNAAGGVAEGLRSLFNQPDLTEWIRDPNEDLPYWRRVLEYSARGNLQSVLDEYAHHLVESEGVAGKAWIEIVARAGAAMAEALRFRTANVPTDVIETRDGRLAMTGDIRFRARFAARYGGRSTEDGSFAKRETSLRGAFNSPFWPFVLCSTSVGQEGLDFHPYCHAVVHWNLPSNPVDLEQREGRVHRFKGHAVRKNVAASHAAELSTDQLTIQPDPWVTLFEVARPKEEMRTSDLVPFWVYPTDGGARIERHVPMIPLSRDVEQADALRRALALYRMAFGQSRQEDLVRYLLTHVPAEQHEAVTRSLSIDLAPPPSKHRRTSGVTPAPSDADYQHADDQGAGLSRLEGLLDAFKALRAKVHVHGAAGFDRLLDDFGAIRTSSQRVE